jgi:uncharacterized protein (TIGR03067 family)
MRVAAFVAVFGIAVFVQAEDDARSKADLHRLQGTWKVLSLEVAGKTEPSERAPKEIVIKGTQLTGFGPEFTIKLDPTQSPKSIDLVFKKEGKEYSVRAAYDVSGDDLTLCLPLATRGKPFENKRPQRLASGDTIGLIKAIRVAKQ